MCLKCEYLLKLTLKRKDGAIVMKEAVLLVAIFFVNTVNLLPTKKDSIFNSLYFSVMFIYSLTYVSYQCIYYYVYLDYYYIIIIIIYERMMK